MEENQRGSEQGSLSPSVARSPPLPLVVAALPGAPEAP